MCLLLALVDVVDGHPLVCVANRDEFYDRPSEPVASRGGDPEVWCGLDKRAGGTWLGMNAAGVVVVLTNRRGEEDRSRASRGRIAMDTLEGGRCAEDAVQNAEISTYRTRPNPFSLVVADCARAMLLAYDGPHASPTMRTIGPGLHTLTNTHDLDELSADEVLRAADGGPVEVPRGISLDDAVARLQRIAKSHAPLDGGPRSACCVHGDGRGTVSSAVLAVDAAGRPARFLAADGAPCVAAWRDVLR